MPSSPQPLFACNGYDIGEERLASHREVVIQSEDGPLPRLGDPFTIMHEATLHDLVVLDVSRREKGWSARCGLARLA